MDRAMTKDRVPTPDELEAYAASLVTAEGTTEEHARARALGAAYLAGRRSASAQPAPPLDVLRSAIERYRRAYLVRHASNDGECEHGFGPPATGCPNYGCDEKELQEAWNALARLGSAPSRSEPPDVATMRSALEEIASWHNCNDPEQECHPDSGPNCQREAFGTDAVLLAQSALASRSEP